MPKPKDAPRFRGFNAPRYTPTPDDLFDELLPDLSLAEIKVLLYIIRRTFGWKKDADDIGIRQLMDGIVTRDGRRLDRGTGLKRSAVLAAVKSLEEWGLIERQTNTDPERGDRPSTYRLTMAEPGSTTVDPPSPRRRTPIPKRDGPPESTTVDPQEPALQKTNTTGSVQVDDPRTRWRRTVNRRP